MAEPDSAPMNVQFKAELADNSAKASRDERSEHAREVRKEPGDCRFQIADFRLNKPH
jgi:hypothetical protein